MTNFNFENARGKISVYPSLDVCDHDQLYVFEDLMASFEESTLSVQPRGAMRTWCEAEGIPIVVNPLDSSMFFVDPQTDDQRFAIRMRWL